MRWIVTGATGQLGSWLVRLAEAEEDVRLIAALDRQALDLAEPERLAQRLEAIAPGGCDVVLNAAAFTAVDRCEAEEELAMRVNAEAPAALAHWCSAHRAVLVHVSTDFVFDGRARHPYREEDVPAPLSAYGRTKLAGELAVRGSDAPHLVVRTSWVYGPGRNFVGAMLEQARGRLRGEVTTPLSVVADQRGRPTYAADLAQGMLQALRAGARGLLHLANEGDASWWEWARAVLDASGFRDLEIRRIRSEQYPRAARTPDYSVLCLERARTLGIVLRPWREALAAHLRHADSGPAVAESAA